MNLFDKLFDVSNTTSSLEEFLINNMQLAYDFNNLNYKETIKYVESAERYVLLKNTIIEQLDFSKSQNKAFISILFDFFERFSCASALRVVSNILKDNDINIGHRLCAANLYLFGIDAASTLLNRYDSICEHLQIALQYEEDNEKKVTSTFLNYYSYVLKTVNSRFIVELKNKIVTSLETSQYPFLKSQFISDLLSIDCDNVENAFSQIQSLIDCILGKYGAEITLPEIDDEEILIEKGSSYAKLLSLTSKDFKSIRKISVCEFEKVTNPDEVFNSLGRGVLILKDESQLFSYMKSFGCTHHAKLLSAFNKTPLEEITSEIDLVDWGCGQGVASMVFFDFLLKKSISLNTKTLTLIEPSSISIKRAALHTTFYNKNIKIKTICRELDSLTFNEVTTKPKNTKIHFFSNILDVDNFSITELIKLVENTQKGVNYFICISPYVTDAKADRVDSFCRYFKNNYDTYELILTETNGGRQGDEYWNCINRYNDCMCANHPYHCNGRNKWTRIIRVFKVDFLQEPTGV